MTPPVTTATVGGMTRHRIPVPPVPSDLAPGLAPDLPHAPFLLLAAEQVADAGGDGPTLLGFSFVEGGVDVAATSIPPDPRCVAGGLFGFTAPDHWAGIGVVCGGAARPVVGGGDDPSREAIAVFVVDRDGELASSVRLGDDGPVDQGPPAGLLVDSLYRCLSLPAPGCAPPPEALVLGIWVDRLVALAADGDLPSWTAAALVHPGVPSHGPVAASAETVRHASTAFLDGQDWTAMRARCTAGGYRGADLRRSEARWMDDTMFARWMLSAVPELPVACAALRVLGAEEAAEGVEQVAALLGVEVRRALVDGRQPEGEFGPG